jgi:hypothetical protein
VLALAVRELDLQDDVACRYRERGECILEGFLELERPPLGALVDEVG